MRHFSLGEFDAEVCIHRNTFVGLRCILPPLFHGISAPFLEALRRLRIFSYRECFNGAFDILFCFIYLITRKHTEFSQNSDFNITLTFRARK